MIRRAHRFRNRLRLAGEKRLHHSFLMVIGFSDREPAKGDPAELFCKTGQISALARKTAMSPTGDPCSDSHHMRHELLSPEVIRIQLTGLKPDAQLAERTGKHCSTEDQLRGQNRSASMRADAIRHLNLYVLLRRAYAELERYLTRHTSMVGLKPAEVFVLLLIATSPTPPCQSELQSLLKMSPKATSKLLQRLIRRHLIFRKHHVEDSRKWILLTTAYGRRQLDGLSSSIRGAESPLLAALGTRCWRQLVRCLQALGGILDGSR